MLDGAAWRDRQIEADRHQVCVCQYSQLTHSKHVVALHVLGVLVITLVVKLPEEVECHDGVQIHHDRQQAHSQDQLTDTHIITKGQTEADGL